MIMNIYFTTINKLNILCCSDVVTIIIIYLPDIIFRIIVYNNTNVRVFISKTCHTDVWICTLWSKRYDEFRKLTQYFFVNVLYISASLCIHIYVEIVRRKYHTILS